MRHRLGVGARALPVPARVNLGVPAVALLPVDPPALPPPQPQPQPLPPPAAARRGVRGGSQVWQRVRGGGGHPHPPGAGPHARPLLHPVQHARGRGKRCGTGQGPGQPLAGLCRHVPRRGRQAGTQAHRSGMLSVSAPLPGKHRHPGSCPPSPPFGAPPPRPRRPAGLPHPHAGRQRHQGAVCAGGGVQPRAGRRVGVQAQVRAARPGGQRVAIGGACACTLDRSRCSPFQPSAALIQRPHALPHYLCAGHRCSGVAGIPLPGLYGTNPLVSGITGLSALNPGLATLVASNPGVRCAAPRPWQQPGRSARAKPSCMFSRLAFLAIVRTASAC